MQQRKIEGLIAAPFTPFTSENELNLSLIENYYCLLKRNDVKGAFICGSNGEGVSLTFSEKVETLNARTRWTKSDPDFNLMMFLGGTNNRECCDHAEIVQNEGTE